MALPKGTPRKGGIQMTSEEYIDSLRKAGVQMKKWDGTPIAIPDDIQERTKRFCTENGAQSVSYEIIDPQNPEHTELTVWDCGYAE